MPTITETLRSRWKPEYATRISGGSHAFETALSFLGAGTAKRAELAKTGTLSPKGIAEAMQAYADKNMLPALAKFREQVTSERANLAMKREHLSRPKIDRTDAAAAMLRAEYRSHLRTLSQGEQIRVLLSGDDPTIVDAALEVPTGTLSGMTPDVRKLVVEAYLQRTASDDLAAMADADEALALTEAAIRVAENEINSAIRG